jgi:rhomboid protease GluP
VSYALLGSYVLVWLTMVGAGVDPFAPSAMTLLRWGGNLGVLTVQGEWWRLLTATFLHAGIIHLAFNGYFLWVIGRTTEQVFGPLAYALLYFGSGLTASMVSMIWRMDAVSVGASGALFGLFGGFFALTVRRRDVLPPAFVKSVRRNAVSLIGINLLIGLGVKGVDLAAHVGGLLSGFGIGFLLAVLVEGPEEGEAARRRRRLRAVLIVAAIVAASLIAATLVLSNLTSPT